MCGIFGVMNFSEWGVTEKDITVFRELMLVSAIRGMDGTGMIYIGDEYTKAVAKGEPPFVNWVRDAVDSCAFLCSDELKKHKDAIFKSRFLAGHCRYATRGKNTVGNTHPFSKDHITMIHNGTINGIDGFKEFKKFDVDSEALCHALAKWDDPKTTLESIDGAAAICWYNEKTHRFNLWRNYQRPLSVVQVGKTIYFASEKEMLHWILVRNNVPVIGGSIVDLATETLFSWGHDSQIPVVREVRRDYSKKHGGWKPLEVGPKVVELPKIKDTKTQDSTKQISTSPSQKGSSTDADSTKEDKRHVVLLDEYYGLLVGDTIVWEPTHVEYYGDKGGCVQGTIWAIPDTTKQNHCFMEKVVVNAFFKGMEKTEITQLYKATLLKGEVMSITLDKKDPTLVKCFLSNVVEAADAAEVKRDEKTTEAATV